MGADTRDECMLACAPFSFNVRNDFAGEGWIEYI